MSFLFMFYESEIILSPSGKVTVVTTGKESRREENYSSTYQEITTKQHPSVEELRKAITREKLETESLRVFGVIMLGAGTWMTVTSLFNHTEPDYKGILSGFVALAIGHSAWKEGQGDKPKVDSRIQAFNRDLPDLKPIPLNIKDYLAKRIPFL